MKRSHLIFTAIAALVLPLSALADDHGNTLGTATNWTTPNIAGNISQVTGNYGLNATFVSGSLTQLSSPSVVVGAQRTGGIDVTSNTTWTVGGLPSWITSSSASGTGSGRVTLTYSPNLSGATREAVITIGGQSYTIVQRAEGDLTGSAVPAELSLSLGIIITVPTSVGVQYRIETSTDMSQWDETGVVLQGDGGPQNVAFAKIEARAFYRAVPQ